MIRKLFSLCCDIPSTNEETELIKHLKNDSIFPKNSNVPTKSKNIHSKIENDVLLVFALEVTLSNNSL